MLVVCRELVETAYGHGGNEAGDSEERDDRGLHLD